MRYIFERKNKANRTLPNLASQVFADPAAHVRVNKYASLWFFFQHVQVQRHDFGIHNRNCNCNNFASVVPRDTSGNHKTCLNQKQFSTSPFQVLCASPQRHCISSGYTSKYAGNWDVCEHGMDYDTNLLKSRYCGNNRKTYYTFFNSPEVVRCFLHQIFFPDMRKNEMVKSTARATSDFHKFPPFIVVKCVFPNKLPRHIAQKRKYVDGCLVKAVRSGCL